MFDTRLLFNLKDKMIVKLPYSDITEESIDELRTNLCTLIEKSFKTVIILDFSKVSLIEGSGYAALLKGWFKCNAKGVKLILCGLNKTLHNTMIEKGLDRFITIEKDLESAIKEANIFITDMRKYCDKSGVFASLFGVDGETVDLPATCKILNLKDNIKEKLNHVSYSI